MEITGINVIIRTVTNYFTGKVIVQSDHWITLVDAAWIADTGRWSDAISHGTLNEVEPYPADQPVHIAIGAIVDITSWNHELPRTAR
jgi:hypothetical protein